MRRPLAVRATPPLLVATFALAASLALAVQASAMPTAAQPVASVTELAQVEGVTATGPSRIAETSIADRRRAYAPSGGLVGSLTSAAGPTSTTAPASKASTTTATPTVAPTRATTTTAPVWWSRYTGTNHVWMPTLGVSKSVYSYACSQTTYPANVVYRWGCGGSNNVYLFGHNYGVFYPLYDAWLDGRLQKGLPVVYADGGGRTRLYRVVSWRVVVPTDSGWAIASQPVPSMTLQTCSNKAGTMRLVVRLVSVAT